MPALCRDILRASRQIWWTKCGTLQNWFCRTRNVIETFLDTACFSSFDARVEIAFLFYFCPGFFAACGVETFLHFFRNWTTWLRRSSPMRMLESTFQSVRAGRMWWECNRYTETNGENHRKASFVRRTVFTWSFHPEIPTPGHCILSLSLNVQPKDLL